MNKVKIHYGYTQVYQSDLIICAGTVRGPGWQEVFFDTARDSDHSAARKAARKQVQAQVQAFVYEKGLQVERVSENTHSLVSWQ